MINEGEENILKIGHFQIRAQAQVCRLLCEFLHLKYVDFFLTP
jgi:hypothetical protein